MKYLYKGMAMPGWGDVSGSVLLGWHEKVCGFHTIVVRSLIADIFVGTSLAYGGGRYGMHCARDDGQEACITDDNS